MKSTFFFLFILGLAMVSKGQSDQTAPTYVRFPNIPKFTIYKAPDSAVFTRENLKKKPTVFIVFDPGCDHCQRETDSITSHISRFKNAQIIMITYLPHGDMLNFYHDYKIANYPMITMGSDPRYFFPVFFQVRNLPAIFIYDKNGKFKKSFEGTVRLDKITNAL